MMKKNKCQAVLIYVTLLVAVAAALIAMAPYIQRGLQGVYKSAGDGIGDEEF